jgi:hypothetical protein
VQERKAADSLRRDQLQFNRQDAQTQNQQAAAALAFNIAKLKQSGLMGQEKLGQGQKRIDQSGQSAAAKLAETTNRDANTNQNRSDLLDLRERIAGSKPEASTISLSSGSDANNKTEIKLTKSEYANYLKAQKQWASQAPPETVPGKMWGENKNPAYADYLKKNPAPDPTDFLTSAASTLTAGTPNPTPAAIAYLRANPNLASAFDAKYGQGLAAQKLAQ